MRQSISHLIDRTLRTLVDLSAHKILSIGEGAKVKNVARVESIHAREREKSPGNVMEGKIRCLNEFDVIFAPVFTSFSGSWFYHRGVLAKING
jgi:hypothetical protein